MSDEPNIAEFAPFLREKPNIISSRSERTRLFLAMEDAKTLGFDATKEALIEMLRMHEAKQ